MNSGSIASQSRAFRDCKAIFGRAEMVFLDHQARGTAGFEENADTGKLVHGVLGWDKLAPESMAMYQAGRNSFRVASKPAAEARMWMIEGFAGGIQPWWHHIGAYHDDRRMYHTAEPEMKWYELNEQYLVNRQPVANVGVIWSQRNTDFYGHEQAADLVEAPYRGFTQALLRARIPYIPVHIDDVDRESANLKVLILPNLAAMSDKQCAAVRSFAAKGGSVIATGVTSLFTEFGDARSDFALADLFGAHFAGKAGEEKAWATQSQHSYLRLLPELRAQVWGPKASGEPAPTGTRHAVLRGFEETDIIPYGGMLWPLTVDAGSVTALTFVPAFPVYPPETAWMRQPTTNIPGLVLKGRAAFLPADLDRRYARENLPDYAHVLANLAKWGAAGQFPLQLEGPGLFDCNLYSQGSRLVAHVVNLTATRQMPIDEMVPVGPMKLSLRLPPGNTGRHVKPLVGAGNLKSSVEQGWVHVALGSVTAHEVLVVE
jgi:hypothetical protein